MSENNINYDVNDLEVSNGFLGDLENDSYQPPPTDKEMAKIQKNNEREYKKMITEQAKEQKRIEKEQKKFEKEQNKTVKVNQIITSTQVADDEIESLFGDKPSEIHGKDKVVLLTKIKQYKTLFPKELSKFKIRKNPSVSDLQDALGEIEILIETNSVDGFILDSVFQCIKLVEGVSAITTNYNVTGMADLLKTNPQFNNLCKQLFIKYGIFRSVPPEYQLILIISTTAYICSNKNKRNTEMELYLNEPISE